MSKKALIVGIDPGSTSAVAAFNLEGELELLESRKEFSHHEIIEEIIQKGRPVVVTSDKEEMPSTVEKIAQSLGARKFEPEQDLGTRQKKQMGEGENSHEKDAHAAVIHTYNQLKRNIRKINRITEKSGEERAEVAKRYFSDTPGLKAGA